MLNPIWKNRDFTLLISGQTISQFGSAISNFAIPWMVLQMTGSAVQTGLLFAVGFLPYVLVSMPAGVWADTFNRKHLMMIADIGRMLLLISIPVVFMSGHLTVWQLYVVQGGSSAFSALFDTAYMSCLPNIVSRPGYWSCISRSTVAAIGSANTIFADISSYVVSIVTLFLIRKSLSAFTGESSNTETGMLAQIGEGWRYVWQHKLIRTLSLLSLFNNIAYSALEVALIYRIQHELMVAANWAGLIMTSISVGALVGSLLVGRLSKRFSMGILMSWSLAVPVIPSFLIAFSVKPWIIAVSEFIVGFFAPIWNVQSITLRQSVIPDQYLGRCNSIFRMIVWSSIPLGNSAGGLFAQILGAPAVFFMGGLIQSSVWVGSVVSKLSKVTSSHTDVVTSH